MLGNSIKTSYLSPHFSWEKREYYASIGHLEVECLTLTCGSSASAQATARAAIKWAGWTVASGDNNSRIMLRTACSQARFHSILSLLRSMNKLNVRICIKINMKAMLGAEIQLPRRLHYFASFGMN